MAFNFWKFLFGLHRKSDEGLKKQKNCDITWPA